MIPFELPVKFNIAPIHPEENKAGFVNYVTRVGGMTTEDINALIENIIIGKTREFTSNMTIGQIVSDKNAFKKGVVEHVEKELEENGFKASSANIADIVDPPGVDYFKNLMRKATSEANSTSSIAVAEAEKTRIVGEKTHEVTTRQEQATREAVAKGVESAQSVLVAGYEKDLQVARTTNKKLEELNKIEAQMETQQRQIEVDSELNRRRQQQELERLRSEKVITATAESEAVLKAAEMRASAIKIAADANLFELTRKAEADLVQRQKQAEADLYMKTREAEGTRLTAEADLVAQTNKATGIRLQLEAQARGLDEIFKVSHGNPELASQYLLMKEGRIFDADGLFDRLGKHQADAIHGLQPKIHVWNTGSDSKSQYTDVISSLSKSVPPILSALEQQTGIKLPSWLPSTATPDTVEAMLKSIKQN